MRMLLLQTRPALHHCIYPAAPHPAGAAASGLPWLEASRVFVAALKLPGLISPGICKRRTLRLLLSGKGGSSSFLGRRLLLLKSSL